MLRVEGNCVASWSDPNEKGIKVGRGGMKAGIIIGVYGGIESIKKSMYNLEVSVTGHRKRIIDGDPVYGGIALYGRINEDIHYGRVNTEFDVGGIVYTTSDTIEGYELLTTYGSDYVWDHVIQVRLDRINEHIRRECPSLEVGIPERLKDLKESNPLHLWIKALLRGETEEKGHHSKIDPNTPMDSVNGLVGYLTSCTSQRRYTFRLCGLEERGEEILDSETLGRNYVDHLTKIKDTVIEFTFLQLIKRNMRISILWSSICNGGHIRRRNQESNEDEWNEQDASKLIMSSLGLDITSSGARILS
jgi:hypothetical protein